MRGALKLPGPRVLVGHGLLISVLRWYLERASNERLPLFLPEARCLDPLCVPDPVLADVAAQLLHKLNSKDHDIPNMEGDCEILRIDGSPLNCYLRSCIPPARGEGLPSCMMPAL
ncbi:hypothetical protein WKI65_22415 [Streptomyces sp. MS1.AVA.3]|uniref:hypothetical protein n=1 Tax=Streptomyces decoyicus TaxID=249567 RepID=UPI0030C5722D